MSRSNYDEDCSDSWANIRWRGAVNSAIRGKRGQQFLKETLQALNEMPEKKLIAADLIDPDGCVCALGCIGKKKGVAIEDIDPDDNWTVAKEMNIAYALACEISWVNDEAGPWKEAPEQRYIRVRDWVASNVKD